MGGKKRKSERQVGNRTGGTDGPSDGICSCGGESGAGTQGGSINSDQNICKSLLSGLSGGYEQ